MMSLFGIGAGSDCSISIKASIEMAVVGVLSSEDITVLDSFP